MELSLPLARYRYLCRMAAPLRLPDYAGSLLRGQFGASLRRISCATSAPTCEGCPLLSTCPYPAVFAAPAPERHDMQRFSHIPNPYVIEPPPIGTTQVEQGGTLAFNLVLFGRALDHLPLISFALQRAIEQGLGASRVSGIIERIEVQNASAFSEPDWSGIWRRGDSAIAPHQALMTVAATPSSSAAPITQAKLTFKTPLRLQHQGQPVRPHALSPRKLIADLLRRITLLAEFHADRPNFIPNAPELVRHAARLDQRHDLHWHDWSRYSCRQLQEMTLGGVLGTWTLTGDLEPLMPWLSLGQWLHVGKNATLGLGAYHLETSPSTNA